MNNKDFRNVLCNLIKEYVVLVPHLKTFSRRFQSIIISRQPILEWYLNAVSGFIDAIVVGGDLFWYFFTYILICHYLLHFGPII